jgi:hypothetical protein
MKLSLLIPACVLFAGCGGNDDQPREPTVGTEIASGYNRQMEEARKVELQLDQQKRALDAAIEASEAGRREP